MAQMSGRVATMLQVKIAQQINKKNTPFIKPPVLQKYYVLLFNIM
jgi:hypothetical protein